METEFRYVGRGAGQYSPMGDAGAEKPNLYLPILAGSCCLALSAVMAWLLVPETSTRFFRGMTTTTSSPITIVETTFVNREDIASVVAASLYQEEFNSLYVDEVDNKNGLVANWNKVHADGPTLRKLNTFGAGAADLQIQAGDRIVDVNGVHGESSRMLRELNKLGKRELKMLRVTAGPLRKPEPMDFFQIMLDRTRGESFGAYTTPEDSSLLIKSISGGLFEGWNKENPQAAVHPGDRIVAVNGVSGSPSKILEECNKLRVMEMRMLRGKGEYQTETHEEGEAPWGVAWKEYTSTTTNTTTTFALLPTITTTVFPDGHQSPADVKAVTQQGGPLIGRDDRQSTADGVEGMAQAGEEAVRGDGKASWPSDHGQGGISNVSKSGQGDRASAQSQQDGQKGAQVVSGTVRGSVAVHPQDFGQGNVTVRTGAGAGTSGASGVTDVDTSAHIGASARVNSSNGGTPGSRVEGATAQDHRQVEEYKAATQASAANAQMDLKSAERNKFDDGLAPAHGLDARAQGSGAAVPDNGIAGLPKSHKDNATGDDDSAVGNDTAEGGSAVERAARHGAGKASIGGDVVVWARTTSTPAVEYVRGLKAEYFYNIDQQPGLKFLPVNEQKLAYIMKANPDMIRIDPQVYYPLTLYGWPGVGVKDHFATRWTGQLLILAGGHYTFQLKSDDGSSMQLDGRPFLDDIRNYAEHVWEAEPPHRRLLEAGAHELEIKYFNTVLHAGIIAMYSGPDTNGQMVAIPARAYRSIASTLPKPLLADAIYLKNLGVDGFSLAD